MLNRKGQVEDAIEVSLALIGMVIGIVILTILSSASGADISKAQINLLNTNDNPYDANFMATDLQNALQLQLTNGQSLGEMLAQVQEAELPYDVEADRGNRICNEELFTELNIYLSPLYKTNWVLYVYPKGTTVVPLFSCNFQDTKTNLNREQSTIIIIPSTDPEKDLEVHLEVYT